MKKIKKFNLFLRLVQIPFSYFTIIVIFTFKVSGTKTRTGKIVYRFMYYSERIHFHDLQRCLPYMFIYNLNTTNDRQTVYR